MEVRKTTVLVGAEEERKRLNELLQTRASLTGMPLDNTQNHDTGEKFGGNVGFGNAHTYGLGKQYSSKLEEDNNNVRFQDTVNKEDLPAPVKKMRAANGEIIDGWNSGDISQENLAHTARTINRNKLVYSGISS